MKKVILLLATLMLALLLCACHKHDWGDATCTKAKTCATCGEVEGTAKGHDWREATCTKAKTCYVCKLTEGEPLGHSWKDATCTEAKTCSVCAQSEGKAKGHNWKDATCTTPKTCAVCAQTEGKAKGHIWQAATCTTPKTCAVCAQTEGKAKGHNWKDATCTTPKTCAVCAQTEGKAKGHIWQAATCTEAKTCSVCGEKDGEPLGHDKKELSATDGHNVGSTIQYSCSRCKTESQETIKELTVSGYIQNTSMSTICNGAGCFYVRGMECNASASGGYGKLLYKFELLSWSGGSPEQVQDFSESSTFSWENYGFGGAGIVKVTVKDAAGNEVSTEIS